ncbi:hypothetical protein L2E82_16511 [Cichorium intybus]|uniref:Uncharacterized protein n=1 Tax=Cichorium intybus TaxID=13427 RepID=A0ACB9F6D2_CICIN|nr:hypothetical protein L2E82_16511 [Cichorium intybus]
MTLILIESIERMSKKSISNVPTFSLLLSPSSIHHSWYDSYTTSKPMIPLLLFRNESANVLDFTCVSEQTQF